MREFSGDISPPSRQMAAEMIESLLIAGNTDKVWKQHDREWLREVLGTGTFPAA